MNLKKFFNRRREPFKVEHDDEIATNKISHQLLSLLPPHGQQPIIIVCIGTDRSTGDSLGPLIGTFLEEKKFSCFHVFGTLDDPIHAVNLSEKLDMINQSYSNPFIIGVDACLGKLKNVGVIQIGEGPVKPGAGVQKELPEVGSAHIAGIVNVSGFMEFFVLQNTRLSLVMKMAKTISNGIQKAERYYTNQTALLQYDWDEEQIT